MPIILTEVDQQQLKEIVDSLTTSPVEAEEAYKELCRGYEAFASEGMILGPEALENQISDAQQRAVFFKQHAQRLLTNLKYAGQKSEEVFTASRQHIYNTFKRLGIPDKDRDDITDAAIMKLWVFKHAEKYNPITSAWKHHIYLAIYRMAASYYEKRTRDLQSQGFAFQQYEGASDSGGEDLHLEPYELEQEMTPQDKLTVSEALIDFEEFLKKQSPYRTGVQGKHREVCTLLVPGTKEYPLTEPITAFMVRKSDNTCRVELIDGDRPLFPTALVSNIRPNDNREASEGVRIVRTPLTLYHLLMQKGAQIEEVHKALKVGHSTAHNWVRLLQEMFQEWWRTSDHIHPANKWQARPVRICPGCGEGHLEMPAKVTRPAVKVEVDGIVLHRSPRQTDKEVLEVEGYWCDECNAWMLNGIELKIDLPYPWGHVRGTHDLQERSAKYKPKLTVQRCSI